MVRGRPGRETWHPPARPLRRRFAGIHSRRPELESVRVITMDLAVPVSTPELQASGPPSDSSEPCDGPVRPESRRTAPRGGAASGAPVAGIARLFAGNGAHTVQPFPTIPATERWISGRRSQFQQDTGGTPATSWPGTGIRLREVACGSRSAAGGGVLGPGIRGQRRDLEGCGAFVSETS